MAPSDPLITAAPELRMRQADPEFIGWFSATNDTSWTEDTCWPGYSLNMGPTYVGCCPMTGTDCDIPISCAGGTLFFLQTPSGSLKSTKTSTAACTNYYNNATLSQCQTIFLQDSMGAVNTRTAVACDSSASTWSVYRISPSNTPSSSTSTNSSSSSFTDSYSPEFTQTSDNTSGGSKAWIAGAVIGPIVGLALIGAIVYLLLRRRKNNRTVTGQTGSAYMGDMPPNGVGGDTEAKPYLYTKPELYSQPDFQTDETLRNSQYTFNNSNYTYAETPELSVIASPTGDGPQTSLLPQHTSTPPSRSASPVHRTSSSVPRTSSPLAQTSLPGPQNSSTSHPSSPTLPPIHTSPFQPAVLPKTNHAQFENPITASHSDLQ